MAPVGTVPSDPGPGRDLQYNPELALPDLARMGRLDLEFLYVPAGPKRCSSSSNLSSGVLAEDVCPTSMMD